MTAACPAAAGGIGARPEAVPVRAEADLENPVSNPRDEAVTIISVRRPDRPVRRGIRLACMMSSGYDKIRITFEFWF